MDYCPVAERPSGLEAGGNHSESSNHSVVVYLLRFNFFILFFFCLFFFDIFLPFGLFPCILIADHLQLRKIFAMTYF